MSILSSIDRRIIEDVLAMGGGYVLDFSNRTLAEFFTDHRIDIYDDRYGADGNSKANRLRCFLRQTNPPLSGRVLSALLDYRVLAGIEGGVSEDQLKRYRQIAKRLGGEVPETARSGEPTKVESEASLLAHAFHPEVLRALPFLHTELSELLLDRMKQAELCIKAEAHLAAVILCGSVLEGLCLGVGSYQPQRVNEGFISAYNKSAPAFHQWRLRQWIEVLERLGDLSPNISKFGHALRDFRNYVHPHEQLTSGFVPDRHTARISFHVVAAAVDDLAAAHGAGK